MLYTLNKWLTYLFGICLFFAVFICKVNAQTIQNVRVSTNTTHLCPATTYTVLFDTIGTTGSSFTVQLSTSTGSFSLPISSNSGPSNFLALSVPGNAALSNTYAIRVIRTSPTAIVSNDTLKNISITKPNGAYSFLPLNPCAGSTVNFTNTSTGVAPLTYNWTFGAITSGAPANSNAQNPSVSFNAGSGSGNINYGIKLFAIDAYGCVDSIPNNISVKQLPDPRIDTSNIYWEVLQNQFVNCGPTRTSPNFLFSISNGSSTASTNTSYQINWGDGFSNTYSSSYTGTTHLYTSVGYFQITKIVTNTTTGCSSQKNYTLFNGNSPLGNIGDPGNLLNLCNGVIIGFPVDTSLTNQNPNGTTYDFFVNDGKPHQFFNQTNLPAKIYHTFDSTSCGKSITVNGITYQNAFQVSFNKTNPCATTPGGSYIVRVISKLVADFTLPTINCKNTVIPIVNNSKGSFFQGSTPTCSNALNYLWTISPGTLGVDFTITLGSLTSRDISINFLNSGIYSVKLVINQPINPTSGCSSDSLTKTICIQPIPIPNFSLSLNPSNGCKNNTVSITNTSNTLLSCLAPVYTWTIKDSITSTVLTPGSRFTFTSGTNANSVNPVLLFTQKGRYVIRLTISNTCPGNYFKDTLIIIKDIPVVGLPPDIIYCDSQTVLYGATYDSSFSAITQYNWNITQTPGPQTGFSFLSGSSTSRNPRIRFTNFTTLPISYRIILTATNECGVSLPDTQNIIINPQPIVNTTTSVDTFCSGGTTNISLSNNLVGSVSYYWRAIPSSPSVTGYSNNTIGSNGPITQTIFNTGSTIQTLTYRITVKQTSTNCLGDSVDVIITILPIPRVQAANKSICSGTSTNLVVNSTVASSLYTWTASSVKGISTGLSNQSTPISGPINQTIVNNSSSLIDSIRYIIRATANGCNSSDTTIYVLVYPLPVIAGGVQTICSGNTAIYSPTASVVGSTFAYTTSVLSGTLTGFSNGVGNINQTLVNTGTIPAVIRYTITPTGPAPSSCVGLSVNFTVTVNPIPVITVSGSSTICSGTQTNIVLNSNVLGTFYRYDTLRTAGVLTYGYYPKLTDTLGPIAQTIFNLGTINAVVRYTITPLYATCAGTAQVHNVNIIPGPTPGNLAKDTTVCGGVNTGTLILSGFSGTIVRWERSIAPYTTFDSISSTSPSLTFLNLTQTTKYRVVLNTGASGACGEVKTPYVQVTIDSPTIAGSLIGTDTVCISGNSGSLTLLGLRGTVQNWQKSVTLPGTWSIISGSSSVNPYPYTNLTQSTWYRVQVKNGVCPAFFSDSVRIKVDSLPSAAITRDTSYCLTTISTAITGIISANTITSGIGTWRFLSGPNTPVITNQNQSSTTVSNLLNGVYFFEWSVSNGKCPSNLDTLKLTIYQPIVANIVSNQTICYGQTPLFLSSSIPIGGTGTYSYKWQQSSNGLTYSDISGATLMLYQPPSLTSNTWYRRITYSGTCEFVSNAVQITVLPAIANNSIAPNSAVCLGIASPMIFGSTPTGGNGFYHYQWQKYNAGSWVNLGLNDTLKDYYPGLLSATSYFRRVVSSAQCSGTYSLTSNIDTCTIYPLPTVNAGVNYSKCSNQGKYHLGGIPSGGTWSGPYVSSDSINPSQMPLGTYSLVYTFTNTNGCVNRDTVLLSIIAPPVVYAGSDFSICENSPPIQLSGFSPITGGTWTGNGVNVSGMFNPTIAGAGSISLIYSFTAGTGCNGVDTIIVTVNPKPNPNFSLPTQKCALDTFTASATTNSLATIASYLWSVSNTGGFSNSILNNYSNQNIIGTYPENKTTTDASYTIKLVSITNFGCKDSISKSIFLRRRPNAQFSTGSILNCGPASYSISNLTTNVISSYLWSTNPSSSVIITSPSSVNPTILFPVNNSSSVINYGVKLIATRNDATLSCSDTTINPILIYPKPFAGISLAPASSGCSPLSVVFTNTSDPKNSEPQSSMSFVWLFSNFPSDTNRNQSKTYTNSGVLDSVQNIQLIASSKWGCKDTAQTSITVFPFPKSDFNAPFYSACAPFVLNSSSISLQQYPNAVDTYTWQILNKQLSVLSTSVGTSIPSYTLTNPDDTIYYRLITSNIHGCKPDTLTRMFRTISNPRASFIVSDSIGCSPLTISYTNTSSAGVALNWSFGNGLSSTNSNGTVNYINHSHTIDTLYYIKLIITAGGTGCKDSISKPILVYPKPLASFVLPSSYCSNTTLTPTNNSIYKAGSISYEWSRIAPPINSLLTFSNSFATTPNISLPDNQLSVDTSYFIRLRVTSIDGCIHDTTKTISVLRRPLVQFSVPPTFCGPASILLNNSTSNAPSNWLWSISPNTSANISNSSIQNPIINFNQNNGLDSINYTIKLIATRTSSGCLDSLSRMVTIYPKPQAQFSILTQDSCGPRWVKFTNSSNAKNSEPMNSMSYLWTSLGANRTGTNDSGFYVNSAINDSSYNVRLIATSKHGCKDTVAKNVMVYPNAKALFTASSTINCAPFNITSKINNLAFPNANSNYFWYAKDSLIGSGVNFPSYILNTANDSVLIKLKAISIRGCKDDSMAIWFRTIPNPVPAFTTSSDTGCSALTVAFTNTSTPGVTSVWSFSNGAIPGGGNPFSINFVNPSNTNNVSYTAKLVITAGSGCRDSISKSILVYPKPLASFSLPSTNCSNTTLAPTNNSIYKAGSVSYEWSRIAPPINSLLTFSNSFATTPNISLPDNQLSVDTSYFIRLRVTSIDGCIHDTTKTISVLRRPLVQFSVPPTFCGPASILLNNSTSNVTSNWLWSISPNTSANISNSSIQNPIINFNQNNGPDSINYTIKLIATRTSSGCLDSLSRMVTIYPKPQAQFSILTQDSCGPRWVKFTNSSNAKNSEPMSSMSYLWTSLGANRTGMNDSGFYVNSAINDSSYNVRLIATSKHGCKDTTINSVTVRPNAKAVYTRLIGTACAPFDITASNINAQAFVNANSTYEWYKNGVFIGSGITFPGTTIPNQADSVLIKLRAISKNGCKNDSMEMWFYTIENPKPRFTATDSITCSGTLIQFTNFSTPNSGLTYRWELGNAGVTANTVNTSHTFYNYGNLDTTIIVKLVTIAGGTGCLDSISKPIIIKPLPNPNFSLSDTFLCYPKVLFSSNISTQIPPIRNTSYKWFASPMGATITNDTTNTQTAISFMDNQSGISKFYQIKLVAESNFGCIDSIQKSVRIPTRPKAIFTFAIDSFCGPISVLSSSQSLYSSNYQWNSIKIGPIINNPLSNTTTIQFPGHTGIVDSLYPIRLIATNIDGCADTLIKPFRVFPNPITNFTTSLDSGCAPLPIDFFDQSFIRKPASFRWDFGDGAVLNTSLDTVNHTYIGSIYRDTIFTAQLISVSANGCRDTLTKPISIQSGAVANIHLDDTLICSNASNPTKLKITNNSFGSVDTFYWDFGDGNTLITTRDTSIFKAYPFEGSYSIILKAVNSCRTSYDTAVVTVQVPPNVNFTKTDSVGCNPLVVNFTNLSTNTYKASFLWNYGNGNSSANFIPTVQTYLQSLTTDTFYYIRLTVSNFCGSFPKLDTVRVLPKPTAIFLTNTIIGCSPLEIYLSNFSVGLPQNVKWDFGNGDSSIRFNLDYPFKPIIYRTIDTPTVYKIRLIVSNICGSDTMTKFITVLPNTVKSFFSSSAQNGCQSLTVNFKDLSYGGANISWNFGDGSSSSDSSPVHTFSTPGTYKVRQFVNNNCSYDTSSVIIYVYPEPRFTIGKDVGNICVNQPVQFRSNLQDSGSIVWHFGDGDSSIAYNPTHVYTSIGKKVFTATVTSNFNTCKSIQKDSLIVQAIPIVAIAADTNRGCMNHYFNLSAISNGNHYYAWDFGDSNFAVTKDVLYKFNKPGTYRIKVVATSVLGCKDSAFKQIEVYPIPTALFDYTPKDTCNGPVWVNFTNQSVGANSYAWDFGNGNTSNATNPSSYYSGIGKYKIQLTAENTYFCYDTISHDFEIFSKPVPDFDFDVNAGCTPLTVNFTNKSKYSKTYLWYFGDSTTSTLENPEHIYYKAGSYNVSLVAFAGIVCSDSIQINKTIIVHPKPIPSFTHELLTIQKPYRYIVFTSTSINGNKFEWNFGDGKNGTGEITSNRYDDADSGCFTVRLLAMSINNCDSAITDTVCLPGYWKGLYVPNAFTPDYGIPEVREFKPAGIELKSYELKIYTKWGELVWESTELKDGKPAKGWDGKHKDTGNECEQGAYIWTIDAVFTDNKSWDGMLFPGATKHVKFGNVTLIR